MPKVRHTAELQASDTLVILKKYGKTRWRYPAKKSAPNLIQFQIVMPAIIKHFSAFTAPDDQFPNV